MTDMTDSNRSRGPPTSTAATTEPQSTNAAHAQPVLSPVNANNVNNNGDLHVHRPTPPAFASRSGINIHTLAAASRSPSTGASPRSSRDSSPAGRAFRQQSAGSTSTSTTTTAHGMRSRKDSIDASPHRPPSITGHTPSVPSAAAIQRALSAATTPQLQPTSVSEPASKLPRSRTTASGESTPSWPGSPRLKSPPPPSSSRRDSLRSQQKPSTMPPLAPNIMVQRSTSTSSSDNLKATAAEEPQLESEPQNTVQSKAVSRGASGAPTLETVQESSIPSTPVNGINSGASTHVTGKYFDMQSEGEGHHTLRTRNNTLSSGGESGSDNDRTKGEEATDPDSTRRAKSILQRTSYSSLKPKSGVDPSTRNMTVETETVSSIPQSTLGAPSDRVASGRAEVGGTLRVKASNETIRPGKGRKKASRKALSINATSGTSHPTSPPPSEYVYSHGTIRPSRPVHHHSHKLSRPKLQQQLGSQISLPDSFSATAVESKMTTAFPAPCSPQDPPQSGWHLPQLFRKLSFASTDSRSCEASTRADIFEDRVKNAMDEATSDDSDETFVYESNPPEPPVRRSRHHSRTPSGASVTSQQDQRLPHRSIQNALSTPKTRSMKFANAHSSGADEEALERQDGTIRASNTRNGTSSIQHHHLSRPNRNGTGHTSILDDDNSPFFHLNKTRSLTGMPGRQSQNARFAARSLQVSNGTSRKGDGYSSYDMDAEGGDDERTPLMGTVRTPRSARRSTLQTARVRYPDHYPPHRRSMLSRFAGFIVLVIMLLLLAFGVVGFLFAISTPLADASILEIQAVLASEQEIMFDLVVEAINPNLLPINIADMDINVFAKSKYVGSAKWWREHENDTMPDREKGSRRRSRVLRLDEYPGVGRYEDFEDDDPKGNRQTMLLGRVDHFDNPLTFDGSFWKRHPHFSTGSLRLSKPGNRTELGGTERWERVLLHPFELIVRGTLKYKIPLGGRAYAANVGANATVKPEESGVDTPIDDGGRITG